MPIRLTARQIADDLAVRIATGEYAPGARLPTYRELHDLYSIGVTTAAKVYALLQDRGIAVGYAGVGVFVAEDDD
jgi:DNA-binding transcriptional regulator YhcF (GntR family)